MSTRKLPLWQDALDRMEPITFSKTWKVDWLEQAFGFNKDTLGFNMSLVSVNDAIRCRGYKLSSRGMKGQSYYIKPADAIEGELRKEQHSALRCFKRAVELGAGVLANPEAKLTDAQIQALEHQMRTSAARLALCARRNLEKLLPNEPKQLKEGD